MMVLFLYNHTNCMTTLIPTVLLFSIYCHVGGMKYARLYNSVLLQFLWQ